MASSIIPILSASHARALAKVRTAAFKSGSLLQAMFPIDRKPQLVEDWLFARETLALQDPRQQTFAVVREVDAADGGGDDTSDITITTEADRKCYSILAFAEWTRLPRQGVASLQGDAGVSSEAVQQKRSLLFSPDYLPEGTNLLLNSAFRTKREEAKKKYLDEEKDCVLDILCTNPRYERQGHGKALLEAGLKLVDAANVRVYIEATPVAVSLYASLGWKEVEVLEWTLADYGISSDGDGDGKIKLILMMREPGGR